VLPELPDSQDLEDRRATQVLQAQPGFREFKEIRDSMARGALREKPVSRAIKELVARPETRAILDQLEGQALKVERAPPEQPVTRAFQVPQGRLVVPETLGMLEGLVLQVPQVPLASAETLEYRDRPEQLEFKVFPETREVRATRALQELLE